MAFARLLLVALGIAIAPGMAVATEAPDQPTKESKICREAERTTGSRIRTGRKCRTVEEWRREDEARSRVPLSLTVTEGQPDGSPAKRPQ